MKFVGTFDTLKKIIKSWDIEIISIRTISLKNRADLSNTTMYRFNLAGGGIVNWWLRTGTIQFQGPIDQVKILESKWRSQSNG